MNINPNWLAGIFLLAVAGFLARVLWSKRQTAQRRREQQEYLEQQAAERAEKLRKSFLDRIRKWDTVRTIPLIEGWLDGVLRRFLFLPTSPGHMRWLAGIVNSGNFEPREAIPFNNRDPKQAADVERQVVELKAGDCPVAPPGTSYHLYNIALMGSTGEGNTMDEVPHDTVADLGYKPISMDVVEEAPPATSNGASSSVILHEGAFEVPPTATPVVELVTVIQGASEQSSIVELRELPSVIVDEKAEVETPLHKRKTLVWTPPKA
ncbi:MAG: hypothetical protein A3B90_01490 [Candidatus Magasanikbacteria bacterium RIFCSPHIGHO2_02_FULL_41_13]|uniref:Uncharacterized protein n=1 Tax=Candidatus Magasanikbacteria bacterium RIFCSPHIGHO2_02_FULL_41_13 TaxID=1798676 RepID=A0A1F6M4U3_9BACT|nr:MAG: hypothetical protein A3B90_01490 [Candidatus Magasanikbacteria bacterium RIFCSPHIGHO2_02_FULL_41_13]